MVRTDLAQSGTWRFPGARSPRRNARRRTARCFPTGPAEIPRGRESGVVTDAGMAVFHQNGPLKWGFTKRTPPSKGRYEKNGIARPGATSRERRASRPAHHVTPETSADHEGGGGVPPGDPGRDRRSSMKAKRRRRIPPAKARAAIVGGLYSGSHPETRCGKCGAPTLGKKFCPGCGQRLASSAAAFCRSSPAAAPSEPPGGAARPHAHRRDRDWRRGGGSPHCRDTILPRSAPPLPRPSRIPRIAGWRERSAMHPAFATAYPTPRRPGNARKMSRGCRTKMSPKAGTRHHGRLLRGRRGKAWREGGEKSVLIRTRKP